MVKQQQWEARVEWPSDSYANAVVTNHFVISDDGQGFYMAFGHIPPLPGPPPEGLEVIRPEIRASVYLSHQTAEQLAAILGKYVEMRKTLRGDAE